MALLAEDKEDEVNSKIAISRNITAQQVKINKAIREMRRLTKENRVAMVSDKDHLVAVLLILREPLAKCEQELKELKANKSRAKHIEGEVRKNGGKLRNHFFRVYLKMCLKNITSQLQNIMEGI